MQLVWTGRQGLQRKSNNDALALGRRDSLLLCVLVDAAERGANSQPFAKHWARQIVTGLLAMPDINNTLSIVSLLQQEQRLIRDTFLMEIASYCVLCFDVQSGSATTVHAGDCLVGTLEEGGISWWFRPHTLDQALDQQEVSARHMLTRSVNARRFVAPEANRKHIAHGTALIMASDGYWAECLQEQQPYEQTSDDASFLTLQHGAWVLKNRSDTTNSCVMTADIPENEESL